MEKFKDVSNWLRQNKAGSTAVSSPGPPNEGKTTLPATVGRKFMVQPGSDNGQEGPITAASSSTFQSSISQNIFSFSSHIKTPAFSGIFGDKKNMPGDSGKPAFQFGANNGFSAPNMPYIFSASGGQSFSMQTRTLISVNQLPVLSGWQNPSECSDL